jgi:hypothetical protein
MRFEERGLECAVILSYTVIIIITFYNYGSIFKNPKTGGYGI